MKTKQVPIIITLIAGFITCIIGIKMQMETGQFVKTWVIVLVSFYIMGTIAKIALDKVFKEETEEATEEAADGEETGLEDDDTTEQRPESADEEKNNMGDV